MLHIQLHCKRKRIGGRESARAREFIVDRSHRPLLFNQERAWKATLSLLL